MKDFDQTLFRCIDETMAGVMGFIARDALYLDLLTRFSVSRENLPLHIENLVGVLEKNLGPVPTRVISRTIAKRLYTELGIEFAEKSEFGLLEYVDEAKTILLGNETKHR
jgi:hypothetical protein